LADYFLAVGILRYARYRNRDAGSDMNMRSPIP